MTSSLKQKLVRIHAAFGAIRERNYTLNDPVIARTCNDALDDAYLLIGECNRAELNELQCDLCGQPMGWSDANFTGKQILKILCAKCFLNFNRE